MPWANRLGCWKDIAFLPCWKCGGSSLRRWRLWITTMSQQLQGLPLVQFMHVTAFYPQINSSYIVRARVIPILQTRKLKFIAIIKHIEVQRLVKQKAQILLFWFLVFYIMLPPHVFIQNKNQTVYLWVVILTAISWHSGESCRAAHWLTSHHHPKVGCPSSS